MAHFYLIHDTKTGKYYNSRTFQKGIDVQGGRYVRPENANEEIKKLRAGGTDVTDFVIVLTSSLG